MLDARANYQPKAVFSASGLSKARRCLHAWGLRYLLGLKDAELTWPEAQALVKPVPKVKTRPTTEEKLALKVYNSKFRKALGKECHSRLECYYRGGDVDWNDKPGRIALVGLSCLPHPDECEVVEAEGSIEIEIEGVLFRGFRDLLLKQHGRWLLVDHKTTYTFDFFDREKTQRTVKTPAQLKADPQANLYAYAVMVREGLSELACRWVYYRTEGKQAAEAVDFVITLAEATAVVAELVVLAKELAQHVGDATAEGVDVEALVALLEKNPDACKDFGGCEYHHTREGGTCTPPELSPGQRLVRLRTKAKARAALPPKQPKERRITMGFRDKPSSKPAPVPQAVEEAPQDAMPEEETNDTPAPAPALKAARAPRTAPAVAAADDGAEANPTISFAGTTVAVPKAKNAALHKLIVTICKAQAAAEAALSGEL